MSYLYLRPFSTHQELSLTFHQLCVFFSLLQTLADVRSRLARADQQISELTNQNRALNEQLSQIPARLQAEENLRESLFKAEERASELERKLEVDQKGRIATLEQEKKNLEGRIKQLQGTNWLTEFMTTVTVPLRLSL